MTKADRETLFSIARARLANRPGVYERFVYAMNYGLLGSVFQAEQAIYLRSAIYEFLPPDAAADMRHKAMIAFVDRWAAGQPAPKPLEVPPLPPQESAAHVAALSAPKAQSLRALELPEIMKRAALVAELSSEWPSIEDDISEASRNGLKNAAHAGRHGGWRVSEAIAWARANGKMKRPRAVAPTASGPWAGLVRN